MHRLFICPGGLEIVNKKFKKDMHIKNEIVFSALGSMEYYKGTDILIEAWNNSEALKRSEKVKLIIAGKNKMGLKKEDIHAENVIFLDHFIPDEEFVALIELSDLILLPYRQISQSGLLLSAFSAKKKVLVSTAGELTDSFKFGNIGWVLQKTDSEELRKLLEKLLERIHDVATPVSEGAWELIRAEYDWVPIGAQTTKLYLKTISGSESNLVSSDGSHHYEK